MNGDYKTAKVVIRQGMYHRIKRMFKSFGIEVMELRRIKMGKLSLDDKLSRGRMPILDEFELELIKSN